MRPSLQILSVGLGHDGPTSERRAAYYKRSSGLIVCSRESNWSTATYCSESVGKIASCSGIVITVLVGFVGETECGSAMTESKCLPLSRSEFHLNLTPKDLGLEPIMQMNVLWFDVTLIQPIGGLF